MSDRIRWWTRNDHGFWCDFCGDCLKPDFHFDSEDEWDAFEKDIEDSNCRNCGAPDEFDPEAI
ncbi:hypothetical protein [Martelella soudanensis]|uniref:hypothetical protein n=1 Tax=unclassified Martelella TaxID=2629616 RepID=UPI0015DF7794|nr:MULTISPECIES: hypothetical protein [unclassified Martelella]